MCIDIYASGSLIDVESAMGACQCQGQRRVGSHKAQFDAQGDLDLVLVSQAARLVTYLLAVDKGPILAAQVAQQVASVISFDLGMVARNLPFWDRYLAVGPPSNDHLFLVYEPALPRHVSIADDEHRHILSCHQCYLLASLCDQRLYKTASDVKSQANTLTE